MDEIAVPQLAEGGVCSARDALYALAGQSLQAPIDPLENNAVLGDLASGSARWLLANRAAAQARAAHGKVGLPESTAEWRALQEQERFSTGARESLWSEDQVFSVCVAAVDGYCHNHGIDAGALVAAFDAHVPRAVAFLNRRDRCNANLTEAGDRLLAAARRRGGLELYARHANGSWGVIERALLWHPSARWRREPGALLYENRISLTGDLEMRGLIFTEIAMAADDVLALAQPAPANGEPALPRTLREAVKAVVLALFPNGLPPNAKRRNDKIVAELERRYEIRASARTISTAIAELKDAGTLAS